MTSNAEAEVAKARVLRTMLRSVAREYMMFEGMREERGNGELKGERGMVGRQERRVQRKEKGLYMCGTLHSAMACGRL